MTPTDKPRSQEHKDRFHQQPPPVQSRYFFSPYSSHIFDGTGSSPGPHGRPREAHGKTSLARVSAQSRTSCKIIVVERDLVIPLSLQFADGYAREVRATHFSQPWNSLVNVHAGESPTRTRGPRHAVLRGVDLHRLFWLLVAYVRWRLHHDMSFSYSTNSMWCNLPI